MIHWLPVSYPVMGSLEQEHNEIMEKGGTKNLVRTVRSDDDFRRVFRLAGIAGLLGHKACEQRRVTGQGYLRQDQTVVGQPGHLNLPSLLRIRAFNVEVARERRDVFFADSGSYE